MSRAALWPRAPAHFPNDPQGPHATRTGPERGPAREPLREPGGTLVEPLRDPGGSLRDSFGMLAGFWPDPRGVLAGSLRGPCDTRADTVSPGNPREHFGAREEWPPKRDGGPGQDAPVNAKRTK